MKPSREESLRQQLATTERLLAESQAREKVLRERMTYARNIITNGNPTEECNWGILDVTFDKTDSTALDAAIAKAKREVLLLCKDRYQDFETSHPPSHRKSSSRDRES